MNQSVSFTPNDSAGHGHLPQGHGSTDRLQAQPGAAQDARGVREAARHQVRHPIIVPGGRDGCIRVWDVPVPEPVVTLETKGTDTARDR
ncbi:hypothetical protein ON010_g18542 [Phytophthora cinnamomi]|nr:hypothetical protein ON010_g18542 [Phytophthora cinnamomi]